MVPLRVLAAAVLAAAPLLAGCTASSGGADPADGERPELAAGMGAIQGLLVDDRYRPLHLTDTPQGEFDAKGFILLVETGATLLSGEDGVFVAVDLEPGTYTLKPSVEGHEGAPVKVDVAAGEYAEADLLVRRLLTPPRDAVAVHDDSLLLTCSMQVTNGHLNFGRACHGDLEDTSESNFVDYNWTGFGDVAAAVVEVKLSRTGDYEFWMTKRIDVVQLEGDLYTKRFGFGTDYIRYAVVNGTEQEDTGVPVNLQDLRVWVNVNGPGSEQTYDATGLAIGADFTFAVKARIVVSAFLEVPANLDSYQLLS